MRLYILVEGPSEKRLLDPWLARLLPAHRCVVIQHQGKGALPSDTTAPPDPKHQGLLHQLPAKLRAFAKSLRPDADAVLVLVDADNDDCRDLKRRLVEVASACAPNLSVIVRIAVEETEAFYLGDQAALKKAFPKAKLRRLSEYQPDSIVGTWELLRDVIGAKREDKVRWAEAMAPHLTTRPDSTSSPSLRALIAGLHRAVGEAPRRRRKPQR